jgi:formylglycine-generating enzyme required for sulfatase activity
MMRNVIVVLVVGLLLVGNGWADTFGSGDNQFTIDFVDIAGDASSANGMDIGGSIGGSRTFSDPINDYRMGVFEITNDQWDKFVNSYGTVDGSPAGAYDHSSYLAGDNIPISGLSWYEPAQFVNWLNVSTGHQAAYKFTGTQGTSNYTFDVWSAAEADGETNLYRHKDAYYFLPTEDEWVKAGYWNGTTMQEYATKLGDTIYQGNGSNGGWNYFATDPYSPWDVGSGSEELNGTFDMMGNMWEWIEGPYYDADYISAAFRCVRGGAYTLKQIDIGYLTSSGRGPDPAEEDDYHTAFRVASVPEPLTISLLSMGTLFITKKRT